MSKLLLLRGLLLTALFPVAALAQDEAWPSRAITVNVGHAAGGTYDAMARRLAEDMSRDLGQSVVVVAKPGAGGVVMSQAVGRSKPDGYQIGFSTSLNVTLDAQAGVVPFDATTVEPLVSVARVQSVLVTSGKQPFNDIAGLIRYTKSKGYSQFAKQALVDELVVRSVASAEKAQIDFIPYKGGSEVKMSVISGQTDFGYLGGGYKADVDAGTLKLLATTDPHRIAAFPNVPTLKELGYPISEESVGLFVVPKGTPDAIKDKLTAAIVKATLKPEYKSFLSNTLMMVPETKSGNELKALLRGQEQLWARLLAAGVNKNPK